MKKKNRLMFDMSSRNVLLVQTREIRDMSSRCFCRGLGKCPHGAVLRKMKKSPHGAKKHLQFWFGRKVLMVPFLFQISTMRTFLQNTHKAPLGLFYFILKCAPRGHLSRSEELHLYDFSPSFHNLHHSDVSVDHVIKPA